MSLTQAMYAASAGAVNNQHRLDVLANNLANINTPGFKEEELIFRVPHEREGDSHTDFLQGPSAPIPIAARTDFSQGLIKHTNNPMDLALEGDGFFSIQTSEGIQYTRNGSFSINKDGVLATKEGLPVLGTGGEIRIDGSDVYVDEKGAVLVDGDEVGRLKVVSISRPDLLTKMGSTLFALTDPGDTKDMTEGFKVMQGYIETSNVNSIRVMTEMIDISRCYESYQKVIQFLDDAAKKSIGEVGRLL